MGVDIKGETGGGVAQKVLDALYIRTAGDGYRSRCVPEVVGPRVRAANAGRNGLEPLVEGVNSVVAPGFIGEYQIVRVAPHRASFQAVFHLLHPLGPEVFKGNARRLDGAGLAAFGGLGNVVFPGFLGFWSC